MTFRLALIALAVLAAALPTPAALVERYYSAALFPVLQHGMTGMSNLAATAVIDVLVVCAAAWLLADAARTLITGRRRGWPRALAGWLGRVAAASSILYLAF